MFSLNKKNWTKPAGSTIAALDIGSSKVACFIGKVTESGGVHVNGIGHNISGGIKSGTFVDMEAAENAIGQAVQTAENMAGETISSVIVNLSAIHAQSHTIPVQTHISGGEVSDNDMRRLLALAREVEKPGHNELLHALPISYRVDDTSGITDPRGMKGKVLKAKLHAVTGKYNILQNLKLSLLNNHLEVETFCVDAYASALSAMIDDEKQLGSVLVDIGAGTTSIALFVEGRPVLFDSIPVGGAHVTNDLARGLTTPLNQAERLKTLHGHAMQVSRDMSDIIDVPQIGNDDEDAFSRATMTSIIQPRMEEILEMVRSRIEASGYGGMIGRRVVLTGGGGLLNGLDELATIILDKQIRVAKPRGVTGLAEATQGPAYSCAAGMLIYGAHHLYESADFAVPLVTPGNVLSRLGRWFKENW